MTLRELRQAKGWTLSEVAEAVGVSQGLVCRWEKGQRCPGRKHMNRLCLLYDMTYEQLFGMEVD